MLSKLLNKKYTIESFRKLLSNKPPDLKEIKYALKSININTLGDKDETFLHYSLSHGLTSCAKFFISEHININQRDIDGKTAMLLAIEKNNKTVAQALVETHNLDITILHDNRTFLQEAVLQGDKHIVQLLLKTKIDKNHVDNQGRNVIFDAIANGNEKIIDLILSIDNLKLNILDSDKKTILHQNNVIEDDKLAIKLIEHGADPTILDANGNSYLLHAALRGIETADIIDTALESGFNINSSVRNKNSILMEIMFSFAEVCKTEKARRKNLMSMATNLVKKGIDVNLLNAQGETALFDAVRKSDIEACSFLIKEKVPINIINKQGESALSLIIYNGMQSLDIIYLLLKHGADVNIKNSYGQGIVEILNDLVLYTHSNINIRDELKRKVNLNGKYIMLLSEVLAITSFDVNSMISIGEPLFFKSLLNMNQALFDLYYKFGMKINTCDIHGDTIFLRYINLISKLNEVPNDFRKTVIMLMLREANINKQDQDGKSILHKIIKINNIKLFRILFAVAKFNYRLQDNRGFTIIHDCISSGNLTILKLLDSIDSNLKNIPDNSGLLPITYAALFGKEEIVLELINLGSHFKSDKRIPLSTKNKLSPLIINLDKISCKDSNNLHNLNILKDQIRRDLT